MAAEDVRPDPLRASNMAKDDLHGLTLELDGVLPAPFQLAGASGHKEKRHARSERPTFAEPPRFAGELAAIRSLVVEWAISFLFLR